MMTKNQLDDFLDGKSTEIVLWGPKYITGIKLIDQQHKELVDLANQLYHACLGGNEKAGAAFKDAMSSMVNYVRFHFGAEQTLLEKLRYPRWAEHKRKHEILIKNILDAVKEYNEGKKYVPNHFVRTLKDWVFGHIAIEDKGYSAYVTEQKKAGLLTDAEIDSITP